jgi:hercynylcysteine S-oxide lyase
MMGSVGELNEYGHGMKSQFLFDPKYTNLNHGSYGTYPLPVRNALRGYQKLSEAAPDKFIRYQYVDLLDKARERVAKLVNAPIEECVFVSNASTGLYLEGRSEGLADRFQG